MANMFDENGNYIKTEWKPGDRITAGKLNKIEESLEAINNNDIERHKEADERLDALEEQNEAVEERFDELEDLVVDNKSEVEVLIYENNVKIDRLEQEMNDGIDTVEAIAHIVDDKIAEADASMKAQVAEAEDIVDQGKADMEAMVAEVEADLEGLHAKDDELSAQLECKASKNNSVEYINIKGLGADNTGQVDCSDIIRNAINENEKGVLYFPTGKYLFSNIELKSGISVVGDNDGATFLIRNNDNPIFFTKGEVDDISAPTARDITIEKVNINGGVYTSNLLDFNTTTNLRLQNLTLYSSNSSLLSLKGVWDSRFINVNFHGGGNDDLQLPSVAIYGQYEQCKQSKEIFFVNSWFESYKYCGIKTYYQGIKPQYIYFNNVKMESFYCYNKHVDITCNALSLINFYINSAYVTTHPVTISNSYGVFGDITIFINNELLETIDGLVELLQCYYVNLNIYSPTPRSVVQNILTTDVVADKRNNINIFSDITKVNGNNALNKYFSNSSVVQQVDENTYNCEYVWKKGTSSYWSVGNPGENNGHEEFYIRGNNSNFLICRALNKDFDNKQIRVNASIVLGSTWDSKQLLQFGGYYIWVDSSGRLRIKNGEPTYDFDGSVVGSQS